MPLCNERDALCLEMSEFQVTDRSVLILIDHCNEMKRQERHSRIITCFLFLVLGAIFILYTQTHSSLDSKHSKNELERRTGAYQQQIGTSPIAHLTALKSNLGDIKYLDWETTNGDAHLHAFNFSNNALIAPQDGHYLIYLQITYRMDVNFGCSSGSPVELKQQVFQRSDRYPEETLLLMALDSIDCSKSSRTSVYTSGVFSLKKGDELKVKAEHPMLIDWNEKKMFFGAFLI
ncbi:hypothetical protein SKAU_G00003440 [Synaphobranchus kaupii]|uniref:THD domain-containing protein n=1 Tax=Synaphobranchus kaupii TaxID=118154 RepID=A0A9Q1G9U2_SYNKA|nr:hypothetical protein SKAU_G00003440 [Synaphobranchus kaupii]